MYFDFFIDQHQTTKNIFSYKLKHFRHFLVSNTFPKDLIKSICTFATISVLSLYSIHSIRIFWISNSNLFRNFRTWFELDSNYEMSYETQMSLRRCTVYVDTICVSKHFVFHIISFRPDFTDFNNKIIWVHSKFRSINFRLEITHTSCLINKKCVLQSTNWIGLVALYC